MLADNITISPSPVIESVGKCVDCIKENNVKLTKLETRIVNIVKSATNLEISGRDIRKTLKAHRIRLTSPTFYMLMSQLEDKGEVEGYNIDREVAGHTLHIRHYKMPDK